MCSFALLDLKMLFLFPRPGFFLLMGQQAVPYEINSDSVAFCERRETTVKAKEKVLFSAMKREESE